MRYICKACGRKREATYLKVIGQAANTQNVWLCKEIYNRKCNLEKHAEVTAAFLPKTDQWEDEEIISLRVGLDKLVYNNEIGLQQRSDLKWRYFLRLHFGESGGVNFYGWEHNDRETCLLAALNSVLQKFGDSIMNSGRTAYKTAVWKLVNQKINEATPKPIKEEKPKKVEETYMCKCAERIGAWLWAWGCPKCFKEMNAEPTKYPKLLWKE